jgi:hypothetical protein
MLQLATGVPELGDVRLDAVSGDGSRCESSHECLTPVRSMSNLDLPDLPPSSLAMPSGQVWAARLFVGQGEFSLDSEGLCEGFAPRPRSCLILPV